MTIILTTKDEIQLKKSYQKKGSFRRNGTTSNDCLPYEKKFE